MKKVIRTLLSGLALLIATGIGGTLQAQEKTTKCGNQGEESSDVFLVVEDMPQFKGGDIKDFQKWVMENINYPEEALKNKISGKVFCDFVIDEQGKVGKIKITRSVHKLLDEEVERVIKTSPVWTPGKQRGKQVKVKMSLPVQFSLS